MRKLILTISIAIFSLASLNVKASNNPEETTITFRLNANPNCKSSVEAVLNGVHGISSMSWNAETKKATVTFNPADIKEDLIYVYFAEKGYDTEKLHSKQRNYDALPEECKYQRDPERD